ncbi:MAG: hypothetical protein OXT09_20835 [Myxococcales bacterium]|nr:hypothetical protein [Myxococcales bacterium]
MTQRHNRHAALLVSALLLALGTACEDEGDGAAEEGEGTQPLSQGGAGQAARSMESGTETGDSSADEGHEGHNDEPVMEAEEDVEDAQDAERDGDPYAGFASETVAFCMAYEQTCGFGQNDTFSDGEDCAEDFEEKFSAERQACAQAALGDAADDPATHCERAKGDADCRL